MFLALLKLMAAWIALEPTANFFILIAAAVLFGYVFLQTRNHQDDAGSNFIRLRTAALSALIFLGVVGSFYFLLSSSYGVFYSSALKISKGTGVIEKTQKLRHTWGNEIVQENLRVTQTINRVNIVKIKQPNGLDGYINESVREVVEQESIIGFTGDINLRIADRKFNTYKVEAKYRYQIANQTDAPTLAEFAFPIRAKRFYTNLLVFINGKEIESAKHLKNGAVAWELDLSPKQQIDLLIVYQAQGMGSYFYLIPSTKPVKNFELTLSLDAKNIYAVTLPETTAIHFEKKSTDLGYELIWSINDAILKPKLGIQFRPETSPDPNQKIMIHLLQTAPRGMMFLATLALFTLILCGLPVDLRNFSLFISLFSVNSLALMALDLIKINNQVVPVLTGLMALGLIYLTYRNLPAFPMTLITALSILFLFAYPYAGLIQDLQQRNAFDGIVQAGIIFYIFALTLYIRVKTK